MLDLIGAGAKDAVSRGTPRRALLEAHWREAPALKTIDKMPENITSIKMDLTETQFTNLLQLVRNSADTGNEEWDASMKAIDDKLSDHCF